jgi:hypothetical protein
MIKEIAFFWDITRCRPSKVNRHLAEICDLHLNRRIANQPRNQYKGGRSHTHTAWSRHNLDFCAVCFMLVYCLAYTSTLKMESTCSSEISNDFRQTIRVIFQKTELFLLYFILQDFIIFCVKMSKKQYCQ